MAKGKFDAELKRVIKTVADNCDNEEKGLYSQKQALLKRNNLWFHGIQYVYWDFDSGNWASPPNLNYPFGDQDTRRGTDDYYDYVINILKAHGQNFIAALATEIPSVIFPPADMNEPDDISTARAYNKISELIDNHNPIVFLFINILFIKWNQGSVAIYTYPDTDEKYGTYNVPKYEEDDNKELNKVGFTKQAKTRIKLYAYGPINYKVSSYVKDQTDLSYLRLSEDIDYTLMQEIYDDDDIQPLDTGDRYYRSPSSYTTGLEPLTSRELVPVKRYWIKPHKLRLIKKFSPSLYNSLRDKYPKGLYAVYVGNELEEIQDQNLNDYWTISRSGLSEYIDCDPECQSVVPLQDIKNTTTNLGVDLLEHCIPETFASTEALSFDDYGKIEVAPGYIFKATIPPGMRNLGDAFFTLPKAQPNQALESFNAIIDQEAQFLTGDNPSVFGGSMGSRTPAGEYASSRAASLQRWGLAYHEVADLWRRSKVKAVNLFVKYMADEEKFSSVKGNRSITTYIHRHELTGQVGEVEPQSIERFPMTAQQKQEWLFELMKLNSPEINTMLMHPENRDTLDLLLSFPGLHVPGTNQRLKQLIEFSQLSRSAPRDNEIPSIVPDYDVDDHNMHSVVLRTLLASEIGIDLKTKEPEYYLNCILHLRLHVQANEQQMKGTYGSLPPGYPAHTSALHSQE